MPERSLTTALGPVTLEAENGAITALHWRAGGCDDDPLLIEAAMAFGTGHHGTTLGCLRALDRLATGGFTGRSVADIGCGTAVLAMGAARIWPDPVIASDIDEVAVEVAEANGWRVVRPVRPFGSKRQMAWRCLKQVCGLQKV